MKSCETGNESVCVNDFIGDKRSWPDPWAPNAATSGNRRQMFPHDYRVTNRDHIRAGGGCNACMQGLIVESTSSFAKLDYQSDALQLGIRSEILKPDASL